MMKVRKWLEFFVSGMGFGAISYLCILTLAHPGVAPTPRGLYSVLFISGLIGVLSLIFSLDLPPIVAILLHLVSSLSMFALMCFINAWIINYLSVGIFVLIYIIIWMVLLLEQKHTASRLNEQIRRRKNKK